MGLAGHDYAIAIDGAHACRLINTDAFDLVWLDLIMPEMNGLQVIRWIRQQDRYHRMPIVAVLSSDDPPTLSEQALRAGASALCSKPYDVAAMLGLIDRISANGRTQR